jgi:RNA polymerase sigma factor (sigma-70 family)
MLSDAELISASVDDADQFGPIFDRHFTRVYAYLAGTAGALAAESLTSEVFVIAFEARLSYVAMHGSALPWLFGIARNLRRSSQRKQHRGDLAFLRLDPPGRSQSPSDDIEQRLDAERLAPVLTNVLSKLSPDEREVLLLLAWGDLSYKEIASVVGAPIGTVQSRLGRARTRLRSALKDAGHLPAEETNQHG